MKTWKQMEVPVGLDRHSAFIFYGTSFNAELIIL